VNQSWTTTAAQTQPAAAADYEMKQVLAAWNNLLPAMRQRKPVQTLSLYHPSQGPAFTGYIYDFGK